MGYVRIGGGGGGGGGGRRLDPPEKSQNIGFLSNSCPDPLKNYEATEPAFNVGSSSARQPIRWWADDGPLIVVFGSSHHSSVKKKEEKRLSKWTLSDKISGSAHGVRR